MDSRRTPNHQKPIGTQKSTGSYSKFAKPKSHRKPDANTTLSGHKSHNITIAGSSRPVNPKARQNLDVTLAGAGCPSIKSSLGSFAYDNEFADNLVYNSYLQALMKKQLVKKTIEQHEINLNDQILIHSEQLHKLEDTLKATLDKIEDLKEQSDIVELLQMLKYGVSEIEELCSRYNSYNRLSELNAVLTNESNLVSARNIKPINSQEEYDELILSLFNLKCVLQKIIKADETFKEVDELSSRIKAFNELKNRTQAAAEELSNSNKQSVVFFFKQTSDFFAQKGGYF